MSVTTCSACVLAASAGGAVGGYLAWAGEVGAGVGGLPAAAARCGRGRVACAPILVRSAAPGHAERAGIRGRLSETTTVRGRRAAVR
jgi:hypothetical protein